MMLMRIGGRRMGISKAEAWRMGEVLCRKGGWLDIVTMGEEGAGTGCVESRSHRAARLQNPI